MEILLSASMRDYGYTILTVVIDGQVRALKRLERSEYRRMKEFNKGAYEEMITRLINDALIAYFSGAYLND